MASKDERIAQKKAIDELRSKYVAEIENVITTLISIRDNTEAKDKDRIEASYKLARLLGVRVSEERVATAAERDKVKEQEGFDVSQEEEDRLAMMGVKVR